MGGSAFKNELAVVVCFCFFGCSCNGKIKVREGERRSDHVHVLLNDRAMQSDVESSTRLISLCLEPEEADMSRQGKWAIKGKR